MKDSGTFVRSIIPADANNIVTIVDFNQILNPYKEFEIDYIISHAIILEDFQVKCGLFSLLEADWPQTNALASESATEAEQARIKKEGQKIYLDIFHAYGNGPWIQKAEEILQNKNSLEQPWALMAPAFSTNETALIDEDLKIGVRVAAKAQGVGGLKGDDYLRIFGSWRKVTNWRKKKDDGVEALQNRISALETLLSVFGASSENLPGSNGLVPAPPAGSEDFLLRGDRNWENSSKFATPAQISAAINALMGSAPEGLNTLGELAAYFANHVNLVDPQLIGGLKRFTATEEATNTTTGTRFDGGVAIAKNLWVEGSINQTINYTFRAGKTTDQIIPQATSTKINITSEVGDTNNQYDSALSRLVAVTSEVWRISLYITFILPVTTRIILSVHKNGSESLGFRTMDTTTTNSGSTYLGGPLITIPEAILAPTDYLEVFCWLNSNSNSQAVFGDAGLIGTYWFGKRIK